MKLIVNFLEVRIRYVRINLCSRNIRMPKHRLYRA